MEIKTNGYSLSQTEEGEVEIAQNVKNQYGTVSTITLTLAELPLFIENIKNFQSPKISKE